MLKHGCVLFLFLMFPVLGRAQYVQTDSAIRSRIYRDVCILASDSLQGRKSGSWGERKASEYIISEFRKAGLQPLGTDSGSFLQPFNIESEYYFGNKWLTNQMSMNDKKYNYIEDFGPVSFSANGTYSGHLVVMPTGCDPLDFIKKIKPNYASGTSGSFILLDLNGFHDTVSPELPLNRQGALNLAKMIFSSGVKGILFWDSKATYYKDCFNFRDKDSLSGPVIFLTYNKGKKLTAAKCDIYIKVSIRKPAFFTLKCRNVIGYIDNHAPYTIIFGAHYDHLGINRKNEIRYGADDNASGTATIMELARFLRSSGDKGNNYLFIAFSGEEEWLVGSNYFCEHPTIDLTSVNYMFNFDMVGRLGCEGNTITAIGTYSSPDWKKVFSSIQNDHFGVKKMKGAASFSDHYGFYKKGIPVAYLTTGLHYDYHTPRDVAEKINFQGMVQLVKFSEDFIRKSEVTPRIAYRKVPGWYQFTSTAHYIIEELDYMLTVGEEGME